MERLMINRTCSLYIDNDEPLPFEQLKWELASFKNKFKDGVNFSVGLTVKYDVDGSSYAVLNLQCQSPETKGETEARIKLLKKQQERLIRNEKLLYKQLSEKYGDIKNT